MSRTILFGIGVGTLAVSAAAYVGMGIVFVARSIIGQPVDADMMAIPLILFLLGLLLTCIGWWWAAYQEEKGTPYERDKRGRRRGAGKG